MKRSTSPPPPAQPCGWERAGGASTGALKICLIKMCFTLQLQYHPKKIENYIFIENL
jgi:hypothetical protein